MYYRVWLENPKGLKKGLFFGIGKLKKNAENEENFVFKKVISKVEELYKDVEKTLYFPILHASEPINFAFTESGYNEFSYFINEISKIFLRIKFKVVIEKFDQPKGRIIYLDRQQIAYTIKKEPDIREN